MVMPLKRAYIAPGEYCIFYKHRLHPESFKTVEEYEYVIGKKALLRLMHSLRNLRLTTSKLYTGIDDGSLKVVRVHTADPHYEKAFLISLVVIELQIVEVEVNAVGGTVPFTWQQFYEMYQGLVSPILPFTSVDEVREKYSRLRMDVLQSVAAIYDPTHFNLDIKYVDPRQGVFSTANRAYYATQDQIIDELGRMTYPLFPDEGIAAVSPNWLSAPSPNSPPPVDSGGPGSKPSAIATPTGSLQFFNTLQHDQWWATQGITDPVYVAVFDSIAEPQEINAALSRLRSTAFAAPHRLMESLFNHKELALSALPGSEELGGAVYDLKTLNAAIELNDIDKENFHVIYDGTWAAVQPTRPPSNLDAAVVRRHNYLMPDHGIFVSGLIHSIEPSAKIHLVQVLNDYGVGNLESLWAGFARYWQYWYLRYLVSANAEQKDATDAGWREFIANQRIVFNCSLGFDAPPLHDLQKLELQPPPLPPSTGLSTEPADYYEKLGQDMTYDELYQVYILETSPARSPNSKNNVRPQHQFMAQLWPTFDGLRCLFSANFFNIQREKPTAKSGPNLHILTAAAGNNREETKPHPSALYPASDGMVVGVGALQTPIPRPNGRPPPPNEIIAEYSNIADTPPEDGMYVFGGSANWQPLDPDMGSPNVQPNEGLIGLYLGNLPSQTAGSAATASTNGLAEWAGTSFATPIVSGLVAATLARGDQHPLLTLNSHSTLLQKDERDMPINATSRTSTATAKVLMNVIQIVQER